MVYLQLKQLREAKGWTQEQLAEASGINRAVISRYETRDMGMTIETARKFATALGCTIDDLIGRRRNHAEVRGLQDVPGNRDYHASAHIPNEAI